MHKRFTKHDIHDAELEKYLGIGSFNTLSELKSAREAHLKSDLFLNNRRKIIAHPVDIDTRLEHIRYIDEVELVVNELMKDVKEDIGIKSNDLLNIFQIKFIEAAELFPPPLDVYIPHSEACLIFEQPEEKLSSYQELGILTSINRDGEFNYHWIQLQALFY